MKGLRILGYVLEAALRGMRAAWGVQLISAGTVAVALLVLGGSLVVFLNARRLLSDTTRTARIDVYFEDASAARASKEILSRFCRRPFVRDCRAVSASDARDRFLLDNPELRSAVAALEANPFPASVEVEIDPSLRDRQRLRNFAREMEAVAGVEAVDDGGGWVERWISILSILDWAVWTLGVALGGALIFVVANTIKLVVYARRDEVNILALVGATPKLIRAPFLLEGLLQGLAGGLAALLLLHLAFAYVHSRLAAEWGGLLMQFVFLTWREQLVLVAGGGLLGLVGSAFAVGRFLRA